MDEDHYEMNKDYYDFQCAEFAIIGDLWMCGSAEWDENKEKFSGAYPAGFLKRLKTSFDYFWPKDNNLILHVCSGRILSSEGKRLDIDPKYKPDYLVNAEKMDGVSNESFLWVIADPPYNEAAAQRYYGMKLLNKSKMIKEMTRVCVLGGYVALLDQYSPNGTPKALKRVAIIGVTSVPNQDLRVFTVWQKVISYPVIEKVTKHTS